MPVGACSSLCWVHYDTFVSELLHRLTALPLRILQTPNLPQLTTGLMCQTWQMALKQSYIKKKEKCMTRFGWPLNTQPSGTPVKTASSLLRTKERPFMSLTHQILIHIYLYMYIIGRKYLCSKCQRQGPGATCSPPSQSVWPTAEFLNPTNQNLFFLHCNEQYL